MILESLKPHTYQFSIYFCLMLSGICSIHRWESILYRFQEWQSRARVCMYMVGIKASWELRLCLGIEWGRVWGREWELGRKRAQERTTSESHNASFRYSQSRSAPAHFLKIFRYDWDIRNLAKISVQMKSENIKWRRGRVYLPYIIHCTVYYRSHQQQIHTHATRSEQTLIRFE